MLKEKGNYQSPIGITQQFRFCGNPFRLDFYKGCDFGCKYCFANARNGNIKHEQDYANFEIIEKYFYKAFEENKETKNLTVELLRHKVPLHIGGMADPFQQREWDMKLNYKMIELSNKYNYPLIFSTKTNFLPKEYYEILNPNYHAFQVSIMGYDDDFIKKYETNTPTAKERIEFVKLLVDKGFWCSVRLQPLIDIEQAKKLCTKIDGIASYLTIEHLKIPSDNLYVKQLFEDVFDKSKYYRPSSLRNYELKKEYKIQNINTLKSICQKTPIGCGDNDVHYMSDSRCCCGIDTINRGGYFNNYLKYNLTYFVTANNMKELKLDDKFYLPQCDVCGIFNSDSVLYNEDNTRVKDILTYTNYYCHNKLDMFENNDIKEYFSNLNFDNLHKRKRERNR